MTAKPGPKAQWIDFMLSMCEYICDDCAKYLGGTRPPGHVCTMHTGLCNCCGHERGLSSVGDWNWPDGKRRGMRD